MKSGMTVRILRSSFAAAQALFQRQQPEMAKFHFTSAPAGRPTALPSFQMLTKITAPRLPVAQIREF